MESHVEVLCANSTNYQLLARERGVSGVLSGIGISGAREDHYFRIKVDSKTVHDGFNPHSPQSIPTNNSTLKNYFSHSGGGHGNNGLPLEFPFSDSFQVDIRDGTNSYTKPRFWVSYRIDEEKDADAGGGDYDNQTSPDDSDDTKDPVTNIIGYEISFEDGFVYLDQEFESGRSRRVLLGNQVYAITDLDHDLYFRDESEPLDISIYFQDFEANRLTINEVRRNYNINFSEAHLLVRFPSLSRSIDTISLEEMSRHQEGEDSLTLELSISNINHIGDFFRGTLETVTNFDTIANVASEFTVI